MLRSSITGFAGVCNCPSSCRLHIGHCVAKDEKSCKSLTCDGLYNLSATTSEHLINNLCCHKATSQASQASHSCAHPLASPSPIRGVGAGAVVATAISAWIQRARLVACTIVGWTTRLAMGLSASQGTNRLSLHNLARKVESVVRLHIVIVRHVRRPGALARPHAGAALRSSLFRAVWSQIAAVDMLTYCGDMRNFGLFAMFCRAPWARWASFSSQIGFELPRHCTEPRTDETCSQPRQTLLVVTRRMPVQELRFIECRALQRHVVAGGVGYA